MAWAANNMMRRSIIFLASIIFSKCDSPKHLNGLYTDGKNIEFKFSDSSKSFEYTVGSEMGILQYAQGTWILINNKLHLSGFNNDDIKTINVESDIRDWKGNLETRLEIHTTSDAVSHVKSNILVNGNYIGAMTKDTVLVFNDRIKTLQIKSYLSHTGLLSSPSLIDTLYSNKIVVDDRSGNKNIILNITIHPYDFKRVKFADTLTLKNNHTIYLNNVKLKRVSK